METNALVAQPLAPEDIAPGQYVAPLIKVEERMPFFCSEETYRNRTEPYRMAMRPQVRAPARVVEVCLPFVLIETPKGTTCMIDLRAYRLARVSDQFGQAMFERAKSKPGPPRRDEEVREREFSPWFE